MDRRRFLVATGAGGSTFLGGCVTTQGDNPLTQIGLGQGGSLQGVLQTVLGGVQSGGAGGGARGRLGLQANQAAYAAYGNVFSQIRAAGGDPSRVPLPNGQASLEQVTSQATRFIDALPADLSDVQMAQTWEQLAPLVNHLNRNQS